MIRFLLWTMGVCLVLARSSPAQVCPGGTQGFEPIDYQELVVTQDTPARLTLTQFPPAATNLGMALISVEDAAVRYSLIGTALRAEDGGHEALPGAAWYLCGRAAMENLVFVRSTPGATAAKVRVTLFKVK